MKNLPIWLFAQVCAAMLAAKARVTLEFNRIKSDERGLELLQVLLIILFVVVIAAAVWLLLGDWIRNLIEQIGDPPEIAL